MRKPKVPSLQHLARVWDEDPRVIAGRLTKIAQNPPTFSYNVLNKLLLDFGQFRVSKEMVAEGVRRSEKREFVQKTLLEIVPLAERYVRATGTTYAHEVGPQYYKLSRDLHVPFSPPMVLGTDNAQILPLFVYWKSNPLSRVQRQLWISVASQIVRQHPDLEGSRIEVVDFSSPRKGWPRGLRVTAATDIPDLDENRRDEMLAAFVEGYLMASEELRKIPAKKEAADVNREADEVRQQDIFSEK